MKKERKDKHFIKKPVYEGGLSALRLFIKDNLRYPKAALTKQIEGTVFIRYKINYKGSVIDAKVLRSIGHGCDEEAIRLVKMLKFKISKTRQIKIQYHKSIQIHFKLPEQKESQVILYQYISSKNIKSKQETVDNSGYSYTITIP